MFKARCRQIELEETRNVVDYVDKQKDISRNKLEDAERSLQEFKESSSFAVSDEEGGLLKKLVERIWYISVCHGARFKNNQFVRMTLSILLDAQG